MVHVVRLVGSLAILVSVVAVAAVSGASPAASCQGQTPTILGSPGVPVTGTEAADVIDSNGARRASTRWAATT